jgi:hypothetical protein
MPPAWCIWAVVLFAGGVLILLNIIRNREEIRRRQTSPREAGDDPSSRREPPATDLDRFLREVHRRRRTAQEEGAPRRESPPPVREPRPAPQPFSRMSAPPPRRPLRSEDRPPSRRPSAPPIQTEVIPLVIPVDDPGPGTQRRLAAQGMPVEFPPSQAAPPSSPSTAATIRATSQRRAAIVALLGNPQALRNAIILREIFDPPLCKRHGRTGF